MDHSTSALHDHAQVLHLDIPLVRLLALWPAARDQANSKRLVSARALAQHAPQSPIPSKSHHSIHFLRSPHGQANPFAAYSRSLLRAGSSSAMLARKVPPDSLSSIATNKSACTESKRPMAPSARILRWTTDQYLHIQSTREAGRWGPCRRPSLLRTGGAAPDSFAVGRDNSTAPSIIGTDGLRSSR